MCDQPLTGAAALGDADRAVRLPSPAHAPPTRLMLMAMLAVAAVCQAAQAAPAARIEDVEESLARDPSFKVRVEAALILGRLHLVRSVPALVGALRDPDSGVRAASADALGEIGSPLSRDALVAALRDPEPPVRRAARAALRQMGSGDDGVRAAPGEPDIRPHATVVTSFEVKPVGDPGHRAGPALQSHMRDFLIDQLRPFGDVDPGERHGTYAIDGVIKSLSMASTGRDVEVSCAVQLVVSRQPTGGVFMLTSGQATVQKPKRQFRPQLRPSMEMEALEAAVRGASEDLVAKLARR
ncbi:MAG TPA: HEAT repeat domain-containing protein [Polyangia bacterium]|nr:HEAT repeat domain-containing protein [Polyangia bacterium]